MDEGGRTEEGGLTSVEQRCAPQNRLSQNLTLCEQRRERHKSGRAPQQALALRLARRATRGLVVRGEEGRDFHISICEAEQSHSIISSICKALLYISISETERSPGCLTQSRGAVVLSVVCGMYYTPFCRL